MLRTLVQSLAPALRWEVQPAAAALLLRRTKVTTGIVGLPADPVARQHLREKYQAVLEALHAIPSTAEYRLAVEATVNYKLQLLDTDEVDEAVEEKLGRQLEEEIKMCDNELSLIPKMAEWKPWEVPEGHTVEVIEELDAMDEKLAGGPK